MAWKYTVDESTNISVTNRLVCVSCMYMKLANNIALFKRIIDLVDDTAKVRLGHHIERPVVNAKMV